MKLRRVRLHCAISHRRYNGVYLAVNVIKLKSNITDIQSEDISDRTFVVP